ncbi:hypothetical protein FEM48_Zijuj06G0178400 [Ziziphus jujuba var. spinosa]|uniref:Protein kinase domain-containing protein n=1 Tax=Ziziphus jujuba var. spinosa TaxID=714518 RepID=A0A978VAR1_ZIZJJ|nr:hypothetical protein FEM48_Zijuj06G0178400 [Ziziphus jujuba var. spinosa]
MICALLQPNNNLTCTSFPPGINIPVNPNAPLTTGIVSGNGFLCSLMSDSSSPFSSTSILSCWRFSVNGTNMEYKRLYRGPPLREVSAGNSSICGVVNGTNRLECWQWPKFRSDPDHFQGQNFSSIAVGEEFVCGLSSTTSSITCLGGNTSVVGSEPKGNYSKIAAGFNHACAISMNNSLECWGDMKGEKPTGKFISLALGENRSCGLTTNGLVSCWGENNFTLPENLRENRFISIEAKKSVFCGISTKNYSLFCWGNEMLESQNSTVFDNVMPGTCMRECPYGTLQLPGYGNFCKEGILCYPSIEETATSPLSPPLSPSPPPQPQTKSSKNGLSNEMIAFIVLGSVGSLSLVVVCCYFLSRFCNIRGRKVHDSGPLDDSTGTQQSHNRTQQAQPAQPVLEKRLSHLISIGNGAHLEEFSLEVLLDATGNFSEDHKIGTGSFGSVYHGKLGDGREVAIKRAEVSTSTSNTPGITRKQEDKDSAFVNELDFLSRLNHKHLVRLLGFYEDDKERVLVYEFMENGSLNDHLHRLENSPLSSSWAARIKVALDAARGIEYLHVYSIPPVIHRDIKSSNILLDATWTAKVSDFGLSLMGPEEEGSHLSLLAAGTVGYIDPEYYRLQQLTSKSDVYSFGVVLLELLSGLKAIHKNENGVPRNVVDYMVPYIVRDEIHRVLDPKVPPPTPFEIEAVKYIGYMAADCVALEGRDRPTMLEIVGYMERALAACFARPPRSRSPSIESLA